MRIIWSLYGVEIILNLVLFLYYAFIFVNPTDFGGVSFFVLKHKNMSRP